MWKDERIDRRIPAHEAAIYCIDASEKWGLLVSGGRDGMVHLWKLQQETRSYLVSLDKLKTFDLSRHMDFDLVKENPLLKVV